MAWCAFFVLMWKHAVIRQRYIIKTFVEFASPTLFIALIILLKSRLKIEGSKPENTTPDDGDPYPYTDILRLSQVTPAPYWVLYYPDTLLTNALMEDVGTKLHLQKLEEFDPERRHKGYAGTSNQTLVNEVVSTIQYLEAVIIFQNMWGVIRPDRLNYTIRIRDDDEMESHALLGTMYDAFMRIQWAVDTSFIRLLSGVEVPQALSLQEFPYYHSREAEWVINGKLLTDICFLSLMVPFLFLTSRLVVERTRGNQELMKIVGISNFTITVSHIVNVLPCGLLFAISGTISVWDAVLPKSDTILVALVLLLYYNTIMSLAFACRYISRTGTGILVYHPLILAIPAYIILYIPARYISGMSLMFPIAIATGVLPHMPMFWFWKELGAIEENGGGTSFTILIMPQEPTNVPVLYSICFMVLQFVVFHTLTWYLSLVRPGQYAWALPKNFLFANWCNRRRETEKTPDTKEEEKYKPYFQELPEDTNPGIKLDNVSKVYLRHPVLKNVSFDVPKGQTFVLLGHRGSGKTTVMTVIAGMTNVTNGNIYVNGMDAVKQRDEVRKSLGICPQPDMLFYDLTIEEHIIFFTLLKRSKYHEARTEAVNLAEKLSITSDLEEVISQLSDEMKKRVQIACALAGGADVLVIDDPTAGFDTEDRKLLWDLILSLRGEHTMLITSHYMEEANALGDRVATMSAGALNSSGTISFLKNIVGTGYRLSCTTSDVPKEAEITKVVKRHVPDATVMEHSIGSIAYNLHSAPASVIPKLFIALESNKAELEIETMRVNDLNFEEVYSRLCSGFGPTLRKEELDKPSALEVKPRILRGISLYKQQFFALLKRQIKFTARNLMLFLILQVALPLIMTLIITSIVAKAPDPDWKWIPGRRMFPQKPVSAMNLDMFEDLSDRRVMYHIRVPYVNPEALKARYPKVTFKESDDIANAVLRTGKLNISEYNKYLLGVEVNETDAKILYNTTDGHAAPVALNVLSNMLATRFIPWADGETITTNNNPIQGISERHQRHLVKDYNVLFIYVQAITAIILLSILNNVTLPCKERAMGARQIHKLTGVLPELYWCTTLAYHMALCVFIPIVPIALTAYLMEEDNLLNRPKTIAVMVVIMVMGCLAFLPFLYLLTFYLGKIMCCIIVVPYVIFFCSPLPILTKGNDYGNNLTQPMKTIKEVASWAVTPYTTESALLATMFVARANALCEVTMRHCDTSPFFIKKPIGFDYDTCCGPIAEKQDKNLYEIDDNREQRIGASGDMRCFFCIDEFSPATRIIALAVQFLVFMLMVFITERGIISSLAVNLLKLKYVPLVLAEEEEDKIKTVAAEKAYVKKAIKLPVKQIKDAVLVDNVHKIYVPLLFWKNITAVKGVSFFVKKGTCFGLLGESGAGKTSIMKMIISEESATRGRLFACGYHLRKGIVRTMGYCPHVHGMDLFLTGEEHLALLMTLRGFKAATVKKEVVSWMLIVDAQEFTHQPLHKYSPACARRLCAAAAMCGREELVVLDEPGAGSGGAARRKLWAGVQRVLRQKRTVIITGRTTIQMEALCSRIGIMKEGVLVAVGTPTELRESHPPGYDVVFTISRQASESKDKYEYVSIPHAKRPCSCSTPRVAKASGVRRIETPTPFKTFKKTFPMKFKCTLVEETKTSLFYHIYEAIKYSDLYLKLEELRSEYPTVIEEYTVTAKTLEDAFFPRSKERQADPRMDP